MSYFVLPCLAVLLPRFGERELVFLPSITCTFVVFDRRCSSSSGCLGKVVLFYCGSPFAFHILFRKFPFKMH